MRNNKRVLVAAAIVGIAALVSAVLFFNPFARTAIVADEEWINSLEGEHCRIKYGSQLTEISRATGTKMVVKYALPPRDKNGMGTPCDGGETFTIDTDKFETMTADYEAKQKFYAENKHVVERLLVNPVANPETQIAFDLGWVNIEPVRPGGDRCIAENGGQLIEIGSHESRTLVAYRVSKSSSSSDVYCKDGVVLFIDAGQFTSMTKRYEAKQQELAANRKIVEDLLAHPVSNPRIHKVTDWQWADIEPRTLDHNSCGMEAGGTLTEIGAHGTQILVRYSTANYKTGGTPCDGEEIFFVDAAQFQH